MDKFQAQDQVAPPKPKDPPQGLLRQGNTFASLGQRAFQTLLANEANKQKTAASYSQTLKSSDPDARSSDGLSKTEIEKKLTNCVKAYWKTYDDAMDKFQAQDQVAAPKPAAPKPAAPKPAEPPDWLEREGTDFPGLEKQQVIRLLEEIEGTTQQKPRRNRAESYLEILKNEDPAARSCDGFSKTQIVKKLNDCVEAFWETYDDAMDKFQAPDVEERRLIGTPSNTRDDEEAATDLLARLQQRLADSECAIDGDDRFARVREKSAQQLLSELCSSSDRVDRLLEGGRLASTGREDKERGEVLALVAPFGNSLYSRWNLDFKEHHGVDPTADDVKAWLEGKVEALDYVDAATRGTWSKAIDEVKVATTKLATPTPENPMVGRGGDCDGCQNILAALGRGRTCIPEHASRARFACTCTNRPIPESVALEPEQVLLRASDAATDKLKELAVEHLQALKHDSKLEEYLRARAVFVVAQERMRSSWKGRRGHELHPNQNAENAARGHAAVRRAALGRERYSLAERNLDPFSRRCRVVTRKLKSTVRIRDYTRFVDETDYTRLKDKTD